MSDEELRVVTPEGRFHYCAVFTPRQRDSDDGDGPRDPMYETTIIFSPGTDLTKLKDAAAKCAADRWGDKVKKMTLNSPFLDAGQREEYEGYEDGGVFIRTKSKFKPEVIDGKKQPIISEDEFFSGCWGRASLVPYAYDRKGNKGVAFGLRNIQRSRKDDFLPEGGGGVAASDEFGEIAEPDQDSADSVFG